MCARVCRGYVGAYTGVCMCRTKANTRYSSLCPAFNVGSRDPNSGSHVCVACILCTEPSHSLGVHLNQ